MDEIPTPRTDKAAYYMRRTGPDKDVERWCDLLNESREIERDLVEACKSTTDAERWRYYASSPQTALMLGSKLDPNDQTIDWVAECNRLADSLMAISYFLQESAGSVKPTQ